MSQQQIHELTRKGCMLCGCTCQKTRNTISPAASSYFNRPRSSAHIKTRQPIAVETLDLTNIKQFGPCIHCGSYFMNDNQNDSCDLCLLGQSDQMKSAGTQLVLKMRSDKETTVLQELKPYAQTEYAGNSVKLFLNKHTQTDSITNNIKLSVGNANVQFNIEKQLYCRVLLPSLPNSVEEGGERSLDNIKSYLSKPIDLQSLSNFMKQYRLTHLSLAKSNENIDRILRKQIIDITEGEHDQASTLNSSQYFTGEYLVQFQELIGYISQILPGLATSLHKIFIGLICITDHSLSTFTKIITKLQNTITHYQNQQSIEEDLNAQLADIKLQYQSAQQSHQTELESLSHQILKYKVALRQTQRKVNIINSAHSNTRGKQLMLPFKQLITTLMQKSKARAHNHPSTAILQIPHCSKIHTTQYLQKSDRCIPGTKARTVLIHV